MFREHRIGGPEVWHLRPPRDANMLIPDKTRQCVVYLGRIESRGRRAKEVYFGTGMFVAMDHPGLPWSVFLYLATARHVAEHLIGHHGLMRLNRLDGTSQVVHMAPDTRWYFHDDETVDVAVLPLDPVPDPAIFELIYFEHKSFVTDAFIKSRGIGPGDEVHIVGLFAYVQGRRKNVPIVRMGNIAMIADEPIPTERGDAEAYLIESRSIGGLSGSPVFVNESVWIPQDPQRPFVAGNRDPRPDTPWAGARGKGWLFGLIQGHWDVELLADVIEPKDERIRDRINVGIAVVTPAKKIVDVLGHAELAAMRKRDVGILTARLVAKSD